MKKSKKILSGLLALALMSANTGMGTVIKNANHSSHEVIAHAAEQEWVYSLTFDPNGGSGEKIVCDYVNSKADFRFNDVSNIKTERKNCILVGWSETCYPVLKNLDNLKKPVICSRTHSGTAIYLNYVNPDKISYTYNCIYNKTTLYAVWLEKPDTSVVESFYGDVNFDGLVDIFDFSAVRRFIEDGVQESSLSVSYLDCNADNIVDNKDLVIIKNIVVSQEYDEDTKNAFNKWKNARVPKKDKLFDGLAYELDSIFDDKYKVTVKGPKETNVRIEPCNDGYIISSDNLSGGIIAEITDDKITRKIGIVSKKSSVYIYRKGETCIGAKIDDDGDGIYENEYTQNRFGDVNNDQVSVTVKDVVLFQKYLFGLEELSFKGYIFADCNLDGRIDVSDFIIAKESMIEIHKFFGEVIYPDDNG